MVSKKTQPRIAELLGNKFRGPVVLEELMCCDMVTDGPKKFVSDREGMESRFKERFESRTGIRLRCEDSDVRAAREIADFITSAIVVALPGDSDRLQAVLEVVRDGGKQLKRRMVLAAVEQAVVQWKRSADDSARTEIAESLKLILGMQHDAFKAPKFSTEAVRRELSRSNKREAPRIAAALSVCCKAFGDSDEDDSRTAYLTAANPKQTHRSRG